MLGRCFFVLVTAFICRWLKGSWVQHRTLQIAGGVVKTRGVASAASAAPGKESWTFRRLVGYAQVEL